MARSAVPSTSWASLPFSDRFCTAAGPPLPFQNGRPNLNWEGKEGTKLLGVSKTHPILRPSLDFWSTFVAARICLGTSLDEVAPFWESCETRVGRASPMNVSGWAIAACAALPTFFLWVLLLHPLVENGLLGAKLPRRLDEGDISVSLRPSWSSEARKV